MTITSSSAPVSRRGDAFPLITNRVETVCPFCGVGCGIVLNLDRNDRIVQVDDVPENQSSQGMLCVKGRFGLGFVHSADRFTQPLIRRHKGGDLEPVDWNEALDLVVTKLIEHQGHIAIFGSAKVTNEEGYVLQKFGRALLATNNIDHCARLCHSPSMAGMGEALGSGSTTNSYTDFERAGCLLITGSDSDSNHPVIAARIRRGVLQNGVKLIIANPRRTSLCDIADLWLQHRPGTDVALFSGLAWIALHEGWWDRAFVQDRTEGFDAWQEQLQSYPPDVVAEITGVTVDDLATAARLVAGPENTRQTSFLWGMGITQHTRGVQNVQSIVNLALLTGNIGKPGSGLSPLRGQNNVQGMCDVAVLPDTLPGYQGLGEEARSKFGAAWGCEIPETPGLRMTDAIEAAAHGEIRAIYVTGENPMLTEANLHHVEESLNAVDFLVVQAPFPNETTALADVVLPSACFAEKDGTFINSERRVQRVRKAMEPPGEARSDWEITSELARRYAIATDRDPVAFDYETAEVIWQELSQLMPALSGITWPRLEGGGIQWPCPHADHPGTPLLFGETFPRGRGKFIPLVQEQRAAELPDANYPLTLITGRVLYHWHGGDMTRRVDNLVDLYPAVEISMHARDAAEIGVAAGDPVRLVTRRGNIEGTTRLAGDMRLGEIFVPFVQLQGVAANWLTNNVYDPRARIPEFKVCAVRAERPK